MNISYEFKTAEGSSSAALPAQYSFVTLLRNPNRAASVCRQWPTSGKAPADEVRFYEPNLPCEGKVAIDESRSKWYPPAEKLPDKFECVISGSGEIVHLHPAL
jgi:hypothetical protein